MKWPQVESVIALGSTSMNIMPVFGSKGLGLINVIFGSLADFDDNVTLNEKHELFSG